MTCLISQHVHFRDVFREFRASNPVPRPNCSSRLLPSPVPGPPAQKRGSHLRPHVPSPRPSFPGSGAGKFLHLSFFVSRLRSKNEARKGETNPFVLCPLHKFRRRSTCSGESSVVHLHDAYSVDVGHSVGPHLPAFATSPVGGARFRERSWISAIHSH